MNAPSPASRSAVLHRLRPYNAPADEALVYKSYLRSFHRTGYRVHMAHGAAGEALTENVYYAGQRTVLEGILTHARITVACGEQDEWQAFGFMIYDDLPSGFVLHYIYVKRMFRQAGLGAEMIREQLLGRKNLVYTHYTAPWRMLLRSLKNSGKELIYDPYLAH